MVSIEEKINNLGKEVYRLSKVIDTIQQDLGISNVSKIEIMSNQIEYLNSKIFESRFENTGRKDRIH